MMSSELKCGVSRSISAITRPPRITTTWSLIARISGSSEETIPGEFSANGYDNPISHTRGTISMARASDPNSASSQFFIVQSDSTFLDGQYAGFGHVTSGMDIVDQICKDAQTEDSNGTVSWWNQPKITSIRILD